MSNYSSLKATINANVKTNNNQEITGSVMNSVLNAMVNSLGAGYQFISVATPTNPGSAQTPDYKCFYIATTPGTYTNLGGLVVADGEVALLKYDSSWTKEVTGIASADKLNQLGQHVEDMVKPTRDADFEIADEEANSIVQFSEGHIKTKNFDSRNIGTTIEDSEDADFEIADTNGKVIARFLRGGIQTKNFDSSYIGSIISRYKGKRMSLLGDSISTFGSPSATNQNGSYCYSYYPDASCRYSEDGVDSIEFNVENTYWMKLIRKTGMVLGINDSYRGSKVSGTDNSFNLQTRINHLGENGTPDVILVYGGTNDAGWGITIGTFNTENPQDYTDEQIANLPVSTFADAYRTMLIRLMKKYPLAEIVVVLPTFTASYYTITNLDKYVELIKEACDFFGIKYIDSRVSGINIYNKDAFLVDGIHPNVAGMELLFKTIYKHLIFD